MNNSISDENNIHDSQYVTLDIGDEYDAGLELLPGESIMPRKADIEIAEESGKLSVSVYYPYERLTAIMSKQKFWLSTSARAATGAKTLQNLRIHKENLEKIAEKLIEKFGTAFFYETSEKAKEFIKKNAIPRKDLSDALGVNKTKVVNTMAKTTWIKTPYAGMVELGNFVTDKRESEKRKKIKKKIEDIIKKSKIPFPYHVSEILSETKRKSAIIRNVINETVEEKRYEGLKEYFKHSDSIIWNGTLLKINEGILEKFLRAQYRIVITTRRKFYRMKKHKSQAECTGYITIKMLEPIEKQVLIEKYKQMARNLLDKLEDGNKNEVAEKIIFIFRQISKLRPRHLKLTAKKSKKVSRPKKGLRPIFQFMYSLFPDRLHHRDIENHLKQILTQKPRLLYSSHKRKG